MPMPPKFSRRSFILSSAAMTLTALAVVSMPQAAHAYDVTSTRAINLDTRGLALKGYDPVSYFLPGGPLQGKTTYSEKFNGATYWFANAANRDAFKANAEKYTPAFGGFCAMGMALEQKLDIDPLLWRIVDGKLYLNIHKPAQTRWLEDVKGNIEKANVNWPRLKDRAPNSL